MQGNGSVVEAALQCAHDGWCAWGLPATPERMVGGSALIVKPCPACPSGARPALPSNISCHVPCVPCTLCEYLLA